MSEGQQWTINSDFSLQQFNNFISEAYARDKYITIQWRTGKQRTQTQNNSLHLWLTRLANALNAAGLDMKKVLKPEIAIPWTKDTAKEMLWKPIQMAVCGEESTTDASKLDYEKVYDTLNRHLGMKFGITIEWPSKDQMI
jgi:hypothetical protein